MRRTRQLQIPRCIVNTPWPEKLLSPNEIYNCPNYTRVGLYNFFRWTPFLHGPRWLDNVPTTARSRSRYRRAHARQLNVQALPDDVARSKGKKTRKTDSPTRGKERERERGHFHSTFYQSRVQGEVIVGQQFVLAVLTTRDEFQQVSSGWPGGFKYREI